MNPLARHLRRVIELEGPISVAAFMDAALSDPDHGYYRTRDPLGRAGDFTTAPEVSQMFGELVGLWAAVAWRQLGAPDPVDLIELGPGRGTLMKDALRAIEGVPDFRNALRVHFVETSPALTIKQAASLKGSGHAPEWHESLEAVPPGPFVLIANEFFDALPIRQFVKTGDVWRERLVGLGDGGFGFVMGDICEAEFPDAEDGAIFEVNEGANRTVAEIARRIAVHGGVALIVDYGHMGGVGETLQSVKGHVFHPPLLDPGEADLTAHVDFRALIGAATAAGAAAYGPLPQGAFLERIGLAHRAAKLKEKAPPESRLAIELARVRLADPQAMGALFKVLALAPKEAAPPPGF